MEARCLNGAAVQRTAARKNEEGENAKSCEPEGPQDLTPRLSHRGAALSSNAEAMRSPSGSVVLVAQLGLRPVAAVTALPQPDGEEQPRDGEGNERLHDEPGGAAVGDQPRERTHSPPTVYSTISASIGY